MADLSNYRAILISRGAATVEAFCSGEREPGPASLAGNVRNWTERPRRGAAGCVGFFVLEDESGTMEALVFSEQVARLRPVLTSDQPVLLTGTVADEGETGRGPFRIVVEHAIALRDLS